MFPNFFWPLHNKNKFEGNDRNGRQLFWRCTLTLTIVGPHFSVLWAMKEGGWQRVMSVTHSLTHSLYSLSWRPTSSSPNWPWYWGHNFLLCRVSSRVACFALQRRRRASLPEPEPGGDGQCVAGDYDYLPWSNRIEALKKWKKKPVPLIHLNMTAEIFAFLSSCWPREKTMKILALRHWRNRSTLLWLEGRKKEKMSITNREMGHSLWDEVGSGWKWPGKVLSFFNIFCALTPCWKN